MPLFQSSLKIAPLLIKTVSSFDRGVGISFQQLREDHPLLDEMRVWFSEAMLFALIFRSNFCKDLITGFR
jgi:hypothetical protein